MADEKLSQLAASSPATLPLTGAELVYVVQGGSSKGTTAAALAGALPDATPTTAGKLSATDKARLDQLAASGSPSFAGLTITGTGAVMIPHIHGDVAGTLYFHVKNVSGGPLLKGTPVSVVGAVGDTTTLEVEATNPAAVGVTQAHGLLYADLADNASGHAVLLGELQGVNTAALAPGAVEWVGASGGRTGTRPASNAQQVSTVGRQHATTGTLLVAIQGVEPTAAQIGALTQAAADARYPLTTDSRLSDVREWTAATITQADAEAGTSTTRTAWTAQRWRQAAAAWWLTVTSSVGRSLAAAADAAAARTAIGAGTSNLAVGSAAPANLAAAAAAGTSGEAARADHVHRFPPGCTVIPLTGEVIPLSIATLVTVPYWPETRVLEALPVWMLNTAPVGNPAQFDIRIGGVSIFATLPTIDAAETSTATAAVPAVFSAAFIAASQVISLGASVTFHCTQVGSTATGGGAKVALIGRKGA